MPPTLVVLEATGGLEIPLTGVLAAAGGLGGAGHFLKTECSRVFSCQRRGVVRFGGSGRARRGLQQRGAGGVAWVIFYRNRLDAVKKRLPTPFLV